MTAVSEVQTYPPSTLAETSCYLILENSVKERFGRDNRIALYKNGDLAVFYPRYWMADI